MRGFFSKGSQGDPGYRGAEGRAGVKVRNFSDIYFCREHFLRLSFAVASLIVLVYKVK